MLPGRWSYPAGDGPTWANLRGCAVSPPELARFLRLYRSVHFVDLRNPLLDPDCQGLKAVRKLFPDTAILSPTCKTNSVEPPADPKVVPMETTPVSMEPVSVEPKVVEPRGVVEPSRSATGGHPAENATPRPRATARRGRKTPQAAFQRPEKKSSLRPLAVLLLL